MQFVALETSGQLDQVAQSKEYNVILKHNTTCAISKGVLDRLNASNVELPPVLVLDLHARREVSDQVAERFGVEHQSPQVLLVKDGKCIYTEWGFDIDAEQVKKRMAD